jgi:hypothetical protein
VLSLPVLLSLAVALAFVVSVRVDFSCPLLMLVGYGVLVFRSARSFLSFSRLAPRACSLLVRSCALPLGPDTPCLRLVPVLSCFYAPLLEPLSPKAWYRHQEDDEQDDRGDYRYYDACAHCAPI